MQKSIEFHLPHYEIPQLSSHYYTLSMRKLHSLNQFHRYAFCSLSNNLLETKIGHAQTKSPSKTKSDFDNEEIIFSAFHLRL